MSQLEYERLHHNLLLLDLITFDSYSGPTLRNGINFCAGYSASWQIAAIAQYHV